MAISPISIVCYPSRFYSPLTFIFTTNASPFSWLHSPEVCHSLWQCGPLRVTAAGCSKQQYLESLRHLLRLLLRRAIPSSLANFRLESHGCDACLSFHDTARILTTAFVDDRNLPARYLRNSAF